MEEFAIGRAFTLIEPGPVVLVVTQDGRRDNVMTLSWTMVVCSGMKDMGVCRGFI